MWAIYIDGVPIASWWEKADSAQQKHNKTMLELKFMGMLTIELAEMKEDDDGN